jgi:hypothetical protein
MQVYETRLTTRGALSLVASQLYINDFAAIRAAQQMSSDGDRIEVWRGETCVYASPSKIAKLSWPVSTGRALG